MKNMPIAAILLFAAGSSFTMAEPMTRLERQRLVAHMQMTRSWLVDEVSGLSTAQLQFQPAPGAWNIMDVVEHLAVAEPIYWQDFKTAMRAPPGNPKRSDRDAEVLWYGIDRTQPQKAVAAEDTKRQMRDLRVGLETLGTLHAQMLHFVKTTDDDLRSHVVERERSDAYQWLLLISTHRQRHILQIREIKANPGFPKK